MEVWKMILLFLIVVLRFHDNFPGVYVCLMVKFLVKNRPLWETKMLGWYPSKNSVTRTFNISMQYTSIPFTIEWVLDDLFVCHSKAKVQMNSLHFWCTCGKWRDRAEEKNIGKKVNIQKTQQEKGQHEKGGQYVYQDVVMHVMHRCWLCWTALRTDFACSNVDAQFWLILIL